MGDVDWTLDRRRRDRAALWAGCERPTPIEDIARAMQEEEEGEIAHYRDLYGPDWDPGPSDGEDGND